MKYYETSYSGTIAHILEFKLDEVEFLVTPSTFKSSKMTLKKTSDFAIENNLLATINGDQFYYDRVDPNIGYVYGYAESNGFIYSNNHNESILTISKNNNVTFEAIPSEGDYNSISYNHLLVKNGIIQLNLNDSKENIAARTMVGTLSNRDMVWVVIDGIERSSLGVTLLGGAGFMKSLGCITAINFDGGGSSTMWFNGKVVNKPHDTNTQDVVERLVCNHLGIKSKINLTHSLNIFSNGSIK